MFINIRGNNSCNQCYCYSKVIVLIYIDMQLHCSQSDLLHLDDVLYKLMVHCF